MRDILKTEELDIPEGVTVEIKARIIKVTGPRGSLTKAVRHIDMDIRVVKAGKDKNKVTLAVWQGGRKHVACLRTIRSLINNMIIGVTKVCESVIPLSIRTSHIIPTGFLIQNACGVRALPNQLYS